MVLARWAALLGHSQTSSPHHACSHVPQKRGPNYTLLSNYRLVVSGSRVRLAEVDMTPRDPSNPWEPTVCASTLSHEFHEHEGHTFQVKDHRWAQTPSHPPTPRNFQKPFPSTCHSVTHPNRKICKQQYHGLGVPTTPEALGCGCCAGLRSLARATATVMRVEVTARAAATSRVCRSAQVFDAGDAQLCARQLQFGMSYGIPWP